MGHIYINGLNQVLNATLVSIFLDVNALHKSLISPSRNVLTHEIFVFPVVSEPHVIFIVGIKSFSMISDVQSQEFNVDISRELVSVLLEADVVHEELILNLLGWHFADILVNSEEVLVLLVNGLCACNLHVGSLDGEVI